MMRERLAEKDETITDLRRRLDDKEQGTAQGTGAVHRTADRSAAGQEMLVDDGFGIVSSIATALRFGGLIRAGMTSSG
jgi:hypothetical protein